MSADSVLDSLLKMEQKFENDHRKTRQYLTNNIKICPDLPSSNQVMVD